MGSPNYTLKIVSPIISAAKKSVRKMKNRICAIDAALWAIPVSPSDAAIMATTKKISDHLNIAPPSFRLDRIIGSLRALYGKEN